MAILKFRYSAKEFIVLNNASASFVRGEPTEENITVSFTNGTGQTLTTGQVLYTTEPTIMEGVEGFIIVTVVGNHTLTGSSTFSAVVSTYPSDTQIPQNITYNIDGSTGTINLYYNSRPETVNVTIDKDNREPHIFSLADFTYSDYDGDTVDKVAVFGDVTGFELNGAPYVAGTYVTTTQLVAEEFTYTPLDQDAYYEKDNTYSVMDVNGNASI